MKPAGNSD